MKSEHGEIEVLLCPEDLPRLHLHLRKNLADFLAQWQMERREAGRIDQIKAINLSTKEDQGLLLETVNQIQQSGSEAGLDISSMAISRLTSHLSVWNHRRTT
jgi:hypothetical protein